MSGPRNAAWLVSNQQAFVGAVERARAVLLGALAARAGEEVPAHAGAPAPLDPPAIHEEVARRLGLSAFEQWLFLLTAGVELDPELRRLCAAWHGDAAADRPSFALALAVHPEPHWSALAPERPLRRLELLRLEPGAGLTDRLLSVDEALLHHCLGLGTLVHGLERRFVAVDLAPIFETARPAATKLAGRLAAVSGAVIGLAGEQAADVAKAAVGERPLLAPLPGELLAVDPLLDRAALLADAVLLVERAEDLGAAARWARRMPVVAVGAAAGTDALSLPEATREERERHWRHALNGATPTDPAVMARIAGQPDVSPADIARIATAANRGDRGALDALIARRPADRLAALAQRIEPRATWDDLVLPEAQRLQLRQLIDQVRHRQTVHEQWGFAAKSARGLGLTVLFAGPSGTGKTMTSEIIAAELGMDLYRVDLSALVSKYIGETEKNLERLFAAAEAGPAVLLFDEADALFGKRGAVRDSHDRYANQEVSYLLQRIESFAGIAILTSNLPDGIDPAFLRRFRFVLTFAFPDQADRAAIWARVFPESLPREPLDLGQLARFSLSGGGIRNVAVNGAFLAAAEGKRLAMEHLVQATEAELAKLNQRLPRGSAR